MGGLNFWPVVVAGLGTELVYSVYKIRRKRLPERLKLDGRSLGLLFLVTVFSVNFYLTSSNVAEGAQEEAAAAPIPSSLFSVTQKDVPLPKLGAMLQPDSHQVVIQNPLGKVEVVGTEGRLLRIEGIAHVTGQDEAMLQNQALGLAPIVDFGATMTVAVRAGKLDGEEKDTRRVDLRIEVPKGVELSIHAEHGDLKVSNYEGATTLWTKSGAISVDKLTGALTAVSLNGKVSAKGITGPVTLNAQQGGVAATDILGDVVIKSDSGDSQVQNIGGKLDFTGNYGRMSILSVEGDTTIHANNGLVSCDDLEAGLAATLQDGEFRLTGGRVEGAWTITSTNTKVSLSLPKDSDLKFLGETNKGVIKGPTKQSPGSGTKTGALITEQMGTGHNPLTVRSDNGSIFVDLHE
ncbi:putative adhesin [Tumebacillus permanentifrigoris]|uniref:Putative adhesin n=1 Tax=Tumebacillus permanentifrigoris TaxID=378543 RepID=A0A316DW23_9BACL|nr:putative adhesin [Tumebacillus permanentifrigoris]